MAVTVEGTPTQSYVTSGATLTWSHTAGGDGLFVGGACCAPKDFTSITFNGDALTEKWDAASDEGYAQSAGYIMVAPDAGEHNVVITVASAPELIWGGAVGLTGLDQITPTRTAYTNNTAGDTPVTVTVVDSVDGDLVIDTTIINKSALTAGAGQTSQVEDDAIGGGATSVGISTEPAVGANTVMSWTFAAGVTHRFIGAMALIAAAVGGGGVDTAKKRMSATHLLMPSFPMAILPD